MPDYLEKSYIAKNKFFYMRQLVISLAAILIAFGASAQDKVNLPAPRKDAPMPLYQALQQRASVRDFKTDPIPDQTLSDLLWAALGINREDGRLTAPTAMNTQEIRLYVCRADGCFEYIAKDNCLVKLSGKDVRKDIAGRQGSVADAPVFLVLVADLNRYRMKGEMTARFGAIDCGYVSQNICLACEALGLKTVPRAGMDENVLKEAFGLKDGQLLLINHPVGYRK